MYSNIVKDITEQRETIWVNADKIGVDPYFEYDGKKFVHIKAAQNRLLRFMSYIEKAFPETVEKKGVIESELISIDHMKIWFADKGVDICGKLLLKDDAHLPIAGSVKARGGIYEVLKFAEELAIKNGLMEAMDDHSVMCNEKFTDLFSQFTIQVGSTGNLGLSIGIMSAKLGFKVIVHMSNDAKQWKKDLLREKGVIVKEYDSDYSKAVAEGRKLSDADPKSYFIDDENSEDLFMGYATAALRLKVQLRKKGIPVDSDHPLFVYIPCGVGGAPGGITFGLKQLFGDDVHCFFVEPVLAPCFTLGMASQKYSDISISEVGITGQTIADGLAVGRPSGFVCKMMKPIVSGSMTVKDERLEEYQSAIMQYENIYLEPSACAGFYGADRIVSTAIGASYIEENCANVKRENINHIIWATGGGLYEKMTK